MSKKSRYLVVNNGRITMFWVRACAELFANGGEIKELIYDEASGNYVERF